MKGPVDADERGVYVITEAARPKGDQFTRDAAQFRTWYRASMGVPSNLPIPSSLRGMSPT